MRRDLKLPTVVTAVQVILSAFAGAVGKLYTQNYSWFIQFIMFISLFALVYAVVGLIYINLKK